MRRLIQTFVMAVELSPVLACSSLFLGLLVGFLISISHAAPKAADECTLDLAVRSLRIGGTEKEPGFVLSTNGTNCLKINRPGCEHGLTMLLDNDGGYIWLQGKNDGPIVAIYERDDHAVVGAYSPTNRGRKRNGVDACVVADRDGGRVQLLDKCANTKMLTADKVDPPKCDK